MGVGPGHVYHDVDFVCVDEGAEIVWFDDAIVDRSDFIHDENAGVSSGASSGPNIAPDSVSARLKESPGQGHGDLAMSTDDEDVRHGEVREN